MDAVEKKRPGRQGRCNGAVGEWRKRVRAAARVSYSKLESEADKVKATKLNVERLWVHRKCGRGARTWFEGDDGIDEGGVG